MEDFFENQDIYLNVVKDRIEKFCSDANNLLKEIGKNVVMKREGDDFICSLEKLPEKYREIKLSRDFGCITNELRSILDTAVVALSIKHGAPNNNENKLSYRVVRSQNDENEYRKTLKKSGMPDELIETMLHIQPNNKFGSLESGDENIIELLDGVNNENKHRGHLQRPRRG